jgi:23S rRNA (pseudouridine1915-N3)-methyltransferase
VVDSMELGSEEALLRAADRSTLVALDARGKQMSSEELAAFINAQQTQGTQRLMFAVGGADGFSAELLAKAQVKLSLGKMTLPHELARVMLLEQLYRAFTIIKKHPYHLGH